MRKAIYLILSLLIVFGVGAVWPEKAEALNPLLCAKKASQCKKTFDTCRERILNGRDRCEAAFEKRSSICVSYQEKADRFFARCEERFDRCQGQASTKNDPAAYLSRCETLKTSCLDKAALTKDRYFERSEVCLDKAENRKDRCQDLYLKKLPNRLEVCGKRLNSCGAKLSKNCGL